MAETAAQHTTGLLFNSNRAARLTVQQSRDTSQLTLSETVQAVLDATLKKEMPSGVHGAVQRGINTAVLRSLLQLAADQNASPDVQAITGQQIRDLKEWLEAAGSTGNELSKAHYHFLGEMINRFQKDPTGFIAPPAPYTPPGAPIGGGSGLHLLMCDF